MITEQTVKDIYAADGVNRIWEWTFPVLSSDDIKIKVIAEDGTETDVTEGYELNEALRRITYPSEDSGLPALAIGNKILIYRRTPITQNIDLIRNGMLDAETLEKGYDKCALVEQELAEQVSRSIKFPAGESNPQTNAQEYLDTVTETADAAKAEINAAKTEAVQAGAQAVTEAQAASDAAKEAARQVEDSVSTLTGYVKEANQAKTDAEGFAESARQSAQSAADAAGEAAAEALAESKRYTDAKTGEVRDLVDALQLIKFVDVLPQTGESKYLYAVPQDELTLDGEHIVLLFVWDDTDGWAAVGVQTTAVDLTDYAQKTDLQAEADAREAADAALTSALAQKYGPDNLAAGNGIEIKELPKAGGIDQHTLAVWHFDDDNDPYSPVPASSYFQGNLNSASAVSTQAKFGNKSLELSASGSYFGAVVRNWDLFSGDFTLDFWHRIGNNLGVTICGLTSDQINFDVRNFPFKISSGSLGNYSNNRLKINDVELNQEVEEPKNQWNHIAVTFKQSTSTVTLYLNGELYGSTVLSSVPSGACNLTFYQQSANTQYVDEVRVSDTVRYTGDFTPRTEAYYDDSGEPAQYEISAKGGGGASLPLLFAQWSDHLLEDFCWLRADTFSWQDGTVYTAAYQELLGEYNLVDKFYPFSYTGAASGEIQYFCKGLIPAVGDAVYKLGDDGVYIPVKNTSTGAALLVTSVEMDTNYFGHETALIGITGYSGGKFIQGDYGSTGKIEDTAPRFSAGILETENGVSFVRTPKGYKICAADQHDNVAALYESTGAAWYYILDVPNKRFKLPRTKFGFTGLRTGAGNYVAPGLPNITGTLETIPVSTTVDGKGAFRRSTTPNTVGASAGGASWSNVTFDASLSNPTYGNSTTVQPPATEMYLYFFVGNYTQTAIEQTAGLNAEMFNGKADVEALNGKANTDLANVASNIDYVVESYSDNDGNWYRVWKSKRVEQGGVTALIPPGTEVTITFFKEFANNSYTIISTPYGAYSNTGMANNPVTQKVTTSFNQASGSAPSASFSWYACGQGAE